MVKMAHSKLKRTIIVIFIVLQICRFAESLQKRCSAGLNPNELVIEIKETQSATAQQILAYGQLYEQGCKSVVEQVTVGLGTTNVNSLEITYNYDTGTQVNPDPLTDDCYVVQGMSATEYGVTVVVQQQIGAIQVTDVFYMVICDVTMLGAGYFDVTPIDVSLNNIVPTIQPNLQETFQIAVTDTQGVPLTEVQLGDPVHILVTYTKPITPVGEWPIGVHNYLLTVHYDRNQPTGEVTLIDENGCVTYGTDPNATPFELQNSFTWIGSNQPGNQYYFQSGEFKIAMLEGGNQLHFRGYYRAECYSASEDKCFNQDAYCAGLAGRRKRSTNLEVNGTYDFSVTVSPPGSTHTVQQDTDDHSCDPDVFWIIALVLGILLLLVTITSLLLLFRLYNERKMVRKLSQKAVKTGKSVY